MSHHNDHCEFDRCRLQPCCPFPFFSRGFGGNGILIIVAIIVLFCFCGKGRR